MQSVLLVEYPYAPEWWKKGLYTVNDRTLDIMLDSENHTKSNVKIDALYIRLKKAAIENASFDDKMLMQYELMRDIKIHHSIVTKKINKSKFRKHKLKGDENALKTIYYQCTGIYPVEVRGKPTCIYARLENDVYAMLK